MDNNLEHIIMVDIWDRPLGIGNKEEIHMKGILHRAFSIFIVNTEKQMLIQKRANNKYHSGGLWSNACCSHPKLNYDLLKYGQNRLTNEMGINTTLEEIGSFIYRTKFSEDMYEFEYDHVLFGTFTGSVQPNDKEVSEYKWIDLIDLSKDLMNNPDKYTSWFMIAMPLVLKRLNKL